MTRYRLEIEYEGTRYAGWQVQPDARTVQGVLMDAVRQGLGVPRCELMGSGRTDAGVHALAQTAHLEVASRLPPRRIQLALNDELPADVCVLRVRLAAPGFHARHDAAGRSYLYQIARRRTAFGKKMVWWIKDRLDVPRMQAAAERFVGMHDFRSFTALEAGETRVKLEQVQVCEVEDLLLVRIQGSHFLWKMVRQMIGVLAEVGRGRLTPEDVTRLLQSHSDEPARTTAPPSGLFLERVWYPGEAGPMGDPRPVLSVSHW
ncbi:MAG: tRNA pseudouridine(38-40) synthase TruA [Candidatus Xenobia bacterium]